MEQHGLHVLNGRTQGDRPGKFNFMNKIGGSTIDREWSNLKCIEKLSNFEVNNTLSKTEHWRI